MCVANKALTARYSMVYIENEACPEKKDFLQRKTEKEKNVFEMSFQLILFSVQSAMKFLFLLAMYAMSICLA